MLPKNENSALLFPVSHKLELPNFELETSLKKILVQIEAATNCKKCAWLFSSTPINHIAK